MFPVLSFFITTPTDHVFLMLFAATTDEEARGDFESRRFHEEKRAPTETPRKKMPARLKNPTSLSKKDTALTPGSQHKKGKGKATASASTKKKCVSKETPCAKSPARLKNPSSSSKKDTASTPGSQRKKGNGKGKATASNSGSGGVQVQERRDG